MIGELKEQVRHYEAGLKRHPSSWPRAPCQKHCRPGHMQQEDEVQMVCSVFWIAMG